MRIIAGTYRGQSLQAPRTRATRPTADRARESLFNVLTHAAWAPELEGARVIDLFAGSGGLGFEALSRGAAHCLFVENAQAAIVALRANQRQLRAEDQSHILRRNAVSLGALSPALGAPFTLAFLDPPYNKDLIVPCLTGLAQGGWLTPGVLIVAETAADETPDLGAWTLLETRQSGAAKFWFLQAR